VQSIANCSRHSRNPKVSKALNGAAVHLGKISKTLNESLFLKGHGITALPLAEKTHARHENVKGNHFSTSGKSPEKQPANRQPSEGQVHPRARSLLLRHSPVHTIRLSTQPKVLVLSHFGHSRTTCQKNATPSKGHAFRSCSRDPGINPAEGWFSSSSDLPGARPRRAFPTGAFSNESEVDHECQSYCGTVSFFLGTATGASPTIPSLPCAFAPFAPPSDIEASSDFRYFGALTYP
jgi:hypothetical protein